MILKGKVHKFGDNISTDEIIPSRYLTSIDPTELGRHCMEGVDEDFSNKVSKGDVLVAGRNFGCGSSREQAPLAIKGCGISCVIAGSFARIFYRNSINTALLILESDEASRDIGQGDLSEVDSIKGEIKNLTKDRVYRYVSFPKFMQELIEAGGLMVWVKKKSNPQPEKYKN